MLVKGELPSLNLSIDPEKIRDLLFVIAGATAPLREVPALDVGASSTPVSEAQEPAPEASSIQASFVVSELGVSVGLPKRGSETDGSPLLMLKILTLATTFAHNVNGTEFNLDVSR